MQTGRPHLLPLDRGSRWQGGRWPLAAPTIWVARDAIETRNWKRGSRGSRRRAHHRRKSKKRGRNCRSTASGRGLSPEAAAAQFELPQAAARGCRVALGLGAHAGLGSLYRGPRAGARLPRMAAAAMAGRWAWRAWPAGRGRGWAGADWVGPLGSAQVGREGFCFFKFSENISSAKTITVNSSKCLQGTKNT
jgi:hypothetical protein